jgi:hypothetical protein
MRRGLVFFVFLWGAVQCAAQSPEERISPIIRAIQEESLVGLESVHLRTLAWTDQVRPEALHPILRSALGSAKVRIVSASQGVAADPPFLRLTYDVNDRTLEGGQTVSVYWVSLELVQAVSWNWNTEFADVPDSSLAVTWSALRADVASSPETAAFEIEKQVASLGRQLAEDIAKVNPVWVGDGIGFDADGTMRCTPTAWRAKRSPKTAEIRREEERP